MDIALALDMPPSVVDQLLHTMVDSGYLLFDPLTKLHYPSPRLVHFGGWIAGAYFGRGALAGLLQELHDETGELVTLAARQGHQLQVVDTVAPPGREGVVVKGLCFPIVGSALGAAHLATYSDSAIERTLAEVERMGAGPSYSAAAMELAVRLVRERGYAVGGLTQLDKKAEHCSVAVALPSPAIAVGMALGVNGPSKRIYAEQKELAAHMRESISRWLAGAGDN